MKVTALIFCLALVPFVTAQAEVEEPNAGLVGMLKRVWEDVTGNIDMERYREDVTTRFNEGIVMIRKGWNKTLDIIDDLRLEAGDDFPTAEEAHKQIADSFEELDQMFSNMQNVLKAKIESLKNKVPALQNLDFFGLIPEEENMNEEEAVPEPEPTPETEQSKSAYGWWW